MTNYKESMDKIESIPPNLYSDEIGLLSSDHIYRRQAMAHLKLVVSREVLEYIDWIGLGKGAYYDTLAAPGSVRFPFARECSNPRRSKRSNPVYWRFFTSIRSGNQLYSEEISMKYALQMVDHDQTNDSVRNEEYAIMVAFTHFIKEKDCLEAERLLLALIE